MEEVMSAITQKAHELILQNISRRGDTKLLTRAKEIYESDKIVRMYTTRKGHKLAEFIGSEGESYTVWAYQSGRVFCNCKFFSNLDSYDRQAWGCKHILAHCLRIVSHQAA